MNKYRHDTHCHLDLYDDFYKIVEEIEKNEVYTIAVTNLPLLYSRFSKKIKSDFIRVALGFHPELITKYKKYIPDMWEYLDDTKYIGEIGLDFKKKSNKECRDQILFFQELIKRCNSIGGKILSVHSRGSEEMVLKTTGDNFNGKIILHWYSGGIKQLDIAIRRGFYFSINYNMLKSLKGNKIVERIPETKLLIESDAPFIKINNNLFKPLDLDKTIRKLAEIRSIKVKDMEEILSLNFKQLLI